MQYFYTIVGNKITMLNLLVGRWGGGRCGVKCWGKCKEGGGPGGCCVRLWTGRCGCWGGGTACVLCRDGASIMFTGDVYWRVVLETTEGGVVNPKLGWMLLMGENLILGGNRWGGGDPGGGDGGGKLSKSSSDDSTACRIIFTCHRKYNQSDEQVLK